MLDEILALELSGELVHQNESLKKGMLYKSFERNHKYIKQVKKCLCPGCNNQAISKSHVISKKMSLEVIQKDGKVYEPVFNKKHPVIGDVYLLKTIGYGDASTFSGFCNEHEKIFWDFEIDGKFDIIRDISKQTFRNICRLFVKYEGIVKGIDCLCDEYKAIRDINANSLASKIQLPNLKQIKVEGDSRILQVLQEERQKAEVLRNELDNYRRILWDDILGKDVELHFFVHEIEFLIPVAICGIVNVIDSFVAIDVVPMRQKTILAISYSSLSGEEEKIVKQISEYISDCSIYALNLVESIMIYGTDEWFLAPEVWEKFAEDKRACVLRELLEVRKPFWEEVPFSVFDELRRNIIDIMREEGVPNKFIEKENDKMVYNNKTDSRELIEALMYGKMS